MKTDSFYSPSASHRVSFLFSLFLFGITLLSMAFFQVIKNGLNLVGISLLYPYFIAAALLALSLPGLLLSRKKSILSEITGPVSFLGLALLVVLLYHVVVLEEDGFDVLYVIRFYYGVFILFYGFVTFLFWLDVGPQTIQRRIASLVSTLIVLSFVLAALEVGGIISGVASPDIFWWIRAQDLPDIVRYQSEGITTSIRAYGLASNPAVLGGFSVFLVTYYYGLVAHSPRFKNVVVILLGVVTVLLSRSGTGSFLLLLSLLVAVVKHPTLKGIMRKGVLALSLLAIFTLVIVLQTEESGRLTWDYWDRFGVIFFGTFEFIWEHIFQSWLGLLLGVMNLYQFNKPDAVPFLWSAGEVSYYDFGYLAFLIEFGLVGVLAYLFLLLKLVRLAFPKNAFIPRWSFILLLLSSVHYSVSFWICSQVMAAILLAASIYVRWKGLQHSGRGLFQPADLVSRS